MKDYSDSAMIALLPRQSNWAKVDLPHLTLVYAGKIADLKSSTFNEMAKDSSTLALLSSPQMLVTTGTEIFGDDEKVDVITLRPTQELLAMRSLVEKWNASEFPFRPHVTVGPVGTPIEHIPEFIFFDRVYLSYGEHNMTFKLTN